MRNISIDDINAAILNGGAGSLLVRVELEPASGLDGIIAPAKYAGANNATYVFCCLALFHQLAMLFHTETRDI